MTILSLTVLSVPFFAQEIDTTQFEEIIIKGNRIENRFSQSARDIQIITAQEIEKLPVTSVNELLAYVGGMDVRQRGPFGTQADISMDGGTFEETLVLLNGIKLINSQTAHNLMNLPIPLSAIDHIEIVRGAASRLYGINALTGAINIVTKKEDYSFVEANAFAGSSFQKQDAREGKGIYGGGGVQVTGNFGTEHQSHLLSVSKINYNGQRYNSSSDKTQLFYNGEYRINPKHAIQLMGGYDWDSFGAAGFYASPGDSNSFENVQTGLLSLSSEHQLGIVKLSPRISNRYDEDEYLYIKDMPTIGRSKHYTNALMAEVNASVKTKIGEFGLGWESRFETINSSNIGLHKRDNHGMYAEYKGFFWQKLVTNLGAYVNYNSSYGWQVYPGIDLAYLFLPHWKLATSVGTGQRIPSFTDLYLNQMPANVGNPNLKPENAWAYEANVSYNSKTIKAEVGYFYRDITDFIDWVRDSITEPYSTMNYGSMKMHGIHARIQQDFSFEGGHSLGYFVKYNYLLPNVSVGEKQSKYVLESLKHQFIAGVHYSVKGLTVQVTNRLIERELNKPYDLLDLKINYHIKGFDVYANVSNLLDSKYKESGAVPMPTRWFMIGLKYAWNQKTL